MHRVSPLSWCLYWLLYMFLGKLTWQKQVKEGRFYSLEYTISKWAQLKEWLGPSASSFYFWSKIDVIALNTASKGAKGWEDTHAISYQVGHVTTCEDARCIIWYLTWVCACKNSGLISKMKRVTTGVQSYSQRGDFYPTVPSQLHGHVGLTDIRWRPSTVQKPLDACSNFTLVAVIQYLDQKQLKEEGLFSANNSYVTVCHFREILAGNQEAGHITSTVESREKWIVPILSICLVPN